MARSARKNTKNIGSMPASTIQASSRSTTPTMAAIAARAFALYCERGGHHGRDVEDWLRAERELKEAGGWLSA